MHNLNRFKQFIFLDKKGYTLVEILLVVTIFSLIAGILSVILSTAMRSSTKAEATKEIRQNGEYALTVVEGLVLNARSLNCEGGKLKVIDVLGGETVISCENGRMASNSAYLTSSGVSVSDCSFECEPDGQEAQAVKISFSVNTKGGLSSFDTSSVQFSTRVTLANY